MCYILTKDNIVIPRLIFTLYYIFTYHIIRKSVRYVSRSRVAAGYKDHISPTCVV